MRRLMLPALGFAVMAALAATAPAPSLDKPLPPIPDSVSSQLGWVHVQRVAGLKCNGEDAFGCYSREAHAIELRDSMPLPRTWQVLEHEKVHLILDDADYHFPPSVEDHLAQVVSAARVLEMRNRP